MALSTLAAYQQGKDAGWNARSADAYRTLVREAEHLAATAFEAEIADYAAAFAQGVRQGFANAASAGVAPQH